MKKRTGILLAFIFIVLVIGYNSLFFVEQRVQALILQFGEPIRVIQEPGLNFKVPLAQNIVKFDKRILLFDNNAEEIIAADKKRLIVELFVTECAESWTAESGLVGCFDLKFSSSSCKTSDQFEPWLDLVSDIPSGLKLISRISGPLANAWEFKADPNAESGSGLLIPDFKDTKKER